MIAVTVSDTIAEATRYFEIEVVNTPPYFVKRFRADFTMRFNNAYLFLIPEFKDDEKNAVTVLL